MNFFLFATLIIFMLLIRNGARRTKNSSEKAEAEFWAREHRANSTRRKSLDGLNYITIPLELFPTHILQNDATVLECIETLEGLTDQKIVNLTGYTNTDLKLEYGTANITPLSEYDQNYTVLARTLQKWADVLIETGYMEEAQILMEFAISTGTDVSRTYYELAEYYASQGKNAQIKELKQKADGLRSSSGKLILRRLEQQYPNI